MYRRRILVAAAATLTLIGSISPLGSATASTTTVTFAVSGGALTISAPASAAFGTSAAGSTVSAQLGSVTVSDQRAALLPAWTATVSTSVFTTGAASTGETIPTSAVSYASGPATASTGASIVLVPGQPLVAVPASLATPQTAFSLVAGVGNNSATWNPTVSISIPAAAVAGTYTGTITHSVA